MQEYDWVLSCEMRRHMDIMSIYVFYFYSREIDNEPLCNARPLPEAGE